MLTQNELQNLAAAVQKGIVVTPNNRTAAFLQKNLLQRENLPSHLVKRILPLTAWLSDSYLFLRDIGLVEPKLSIASEDQALWIWRQILLTSKLSPAAVAHTAQLAHSSFKTMVAFEVPWSADHFNLQEDSAVYFQWAQEFQSSLARHEICLVDQLPSLLTPHAQQLVEQVFARYQTEASWLTLFGDITLTPALKRLLSRLEDHGVRLDRIQLADRSAQGQAFVYDTSTDELRGAAQWAQSVVAGDPEARVAIVVRDLEQQRQSIVRMFQDVLVPDHIKPDQVLDQSPFNVSMGRPLLSIPLIAHLVEYLRLLEPGIAPAKLMELCHSPYFLGGQTSEVVVLKDTSIRYERVNADKWDRVTARAGAAHEKLLAMAKMARADLAKAKWLPSEWTSQVIAAAQKAGWPGTRKLSSSEWQALSKWDEIRKKVARYDVITGVIGYRAFLNLLEHCLAQTIFHEQDAEKPIQILGALEAASLPFTHTRIIGFDDMTWPGRYVSNPLIPSYLQQTFKLPNASPDDTLASAEHLLGLFSTQTTVMIYSYSKLGDDGRERAASPLLGNVPVEPVSGSAGGQALDPAFLTERPVETVPYSATEAHRGGTYLIKDFLSCPFRGFAIHRLQLRDISVTLFGLSRADTGVLVHAAMKHLWEDIKTQDNLLALSDAERAEAISKSLREAAATLAIQTETDWRGPYFAQEMARLNNQIEQLLQLEIQRPPFEVVAMELRSKRVVGDLEIEVVIDRIDRDVQSDRLIYWDYKTGSVSLANLHTGRPLDPQLPIYVMTEQDVAGLGYMRLSREAVEMTGVVDGITDVSRLIPTDKATKLGLTTDWQENIRQWSETLTECVGHLQSGIILATPILGEQACRSCSKRWLCRIDEWPATAERPLHFLAKG